MDSPRRAGFGMKLRPGIAAKSPLAHALRRQGTP